uniref:Uncharacterized protein n=1 Tax=Arundo donax TaxID=35708 RepID=A0A0A9FSP8_ARUDO
MTPEARYLLTRFSRSLHPRGTTTGAPPQLATPVASESRRNRCLSPASLSPYAIMVTTAALLSYLRGDRDT